MRGLLLTAAAILVLGAPAAGSAAINLRGLPASVSLVTMYSDPGDFVGGGQQRLFSTTEGDSVTVSGTAASLQVDVSGHSDSFILEFAAAPGQTLQPGLYTGAQRAPFRDAGHPGIDIFGDGRGCNTVSGRFDVKSIETDGAGNVTGLWLTYEDHCEGGTPALFGEVQVGAAPQASLQQVEQAVWWPDVPLGASGNAIPVTLVASGASAVTVSSVALVGSDTASFQITQDHCTGVALAPGAGCQVWVRFVPLLKGPHMASLEVDASGGVVRTAQLDGSGIGGHTELVMHSDSGDFVGQGLSYDFTPANGAVGASGSATTVQASGGGSGHSFQLVFTAPSGAVLTPGTTYSALRWPSTAPGRGCRSSETAAAATR